MQHEAVNLSQGFPDFPAPDEIKAPPRTPSPPTSISTPSPGARKICATRSREKFERTRHARRSRARNHRLLRFHRSHHVHHDGHHQSGRRSRHLRAVLRKLRPRRDSFRRHAALCEIAPAGLDFRSRRTCRRVRPENESHHPQHAEQSHRQSFHARRTRIHSRSLRSLECLRDHRRNLRIHALRRREHISIATLDGMRDRTITINALSKTYSVTGWRVGWAIAPPEVTLRSARCTTFSPSAPPRRLQRRAQSR